MFLRRSAAFGEAFGLTCSRTLCATLPRAYDFFCRLPPAFAATTATAIQRLHSGCLLREPREAVRWNKLS